MAENNKFDPKALVEEIESKFELLYDSLVEQIASNRYAQHLASCMNLGTGVRRAVARTAVTKTKSNLLRYLNSSTLITYSISLGKAKADAHLRHM